MNKKNLLLIMGIIALAAAFRLMKHPPNFTPIAAMSLFGGWYFTKKYYVIIPLVAMFVSDIFIGFYDWRLTAVVYLGIALTFYVGWLLKKTPSWHNVLVGSFACSVTFFVLTNFSVWALYQWYPHSWPGLLECFAMALPFFRNSLAGDMIYTVAFFGAYETAIYYMNHRQMKLIKV